MKASFVYGASLLLLSALAGCESGSGHASSTPDLATPATVDLAAPTLDVPATNATKTLKFALEAAGTGSARVGAINIGQNVGQVVLDGKTLPALSYLQQPWEPVYTLYQTLLVDGDAWYLMWLYCEGDKLTHIYFEGTDGTLLANEPASGTCLATTGATPVPVTLPATTLRVQPNHAFEIVGEKLSLGKDGRGTVQLGSKRYDLLPFEVVDCLECDANGWLELHSVFAPPEGGAAGTMIFYFFASKPNEVLATYGLELPSLADPVGNRKLTATWTYDPPMAYRHGTRPSTRPWPLRPPRD